MLKGFRDFVLRGNVIELAVAVVIGTAFTAIVTAFSESIINPLIASIGSTEVEGLGFHIRAGNAATFVDFGAVITAAINFLIIAAIVYFVLVAPMNKLSETLAKRKGVEEDETPASIEAELLTEIRDLLQEQKRLQ
ncbi:large-conductance mechanosensitive ion channel, MscL-family [Corynebacterium glutamicum MB001]|uniref:Large-conductance mechanosensitive channel n=1 Tax=Corynebacterium glutamicum (strain ATCC 13032 / DSM 20300 / JCM 1318 / BCRC 11384 / CCUG 27702 / LMG 3730 / NBRC 12168 / NCIMB 10025 / NRRL B-2784 / 534) TaxID=196627 RepID=Q8NS07_CORGL|nr:large conductance mechanosensitive channel protein MscL [Corynebacterium glutamicum]AGT04875.1 large-conductance mechanosensitive ion channel, MscL-family [Corynebacterium glutamicum MB001]ARV64933.1 mechanosensitive ion channel protein MscL [Corynebacterium glutamicum]ASW13584.1 large-conductance mechanosensitive ion channel, MscL-family [Corynebacterium glutamicum]AUI00448.1 large conductance mechanosensitive channel protein MscL [Corynebacterium glutamicum]AUI04088.1 large conductance me